MAQGQIPTHCLAMNPLSGNQKWVPIKESSGGRGAGEYVYF